METTRRLACKRCQTRKIKCNRVQPCSNCTQGGHLCEYRSIDGRRRPVSHNYLNALEARLAYFESVMQRLKKASHEERDDILAAVSLDDHLEPAFASKKAIDSSPETSAALQTLALRSGPQGTVQFHGPTSIYLDVETEQVPADEETHVSATQVTAPSPSPNLDGFAILRLASALGVDDALVRETLPLFFLHQYPFCMFIYREAFLSDYYDHACGGRYWSYPLVYAMCALGAPHASRADVRAKTLLLARCAQEVIISHCLTRPSPTTIQALLCLAFHEIGQGNTSQGWLFSGMAFRMGQDIGFHQDPSKWILQDRDIVNPEDIEIRRRIYWGSYLADKLISLYLGRPVYLREDDATVHTTEPLPDFPIDHKWFGLSEIATQHSSIDLQRPQLTAALKHMVLLGKIFQDMMTDVFSIARNVRKSEPYRTSRLGDFNLRLNKWHVTLPESLQWSEWSINKTFHAHVFGLHLYYHAMILSLNRHFACPSAGFPLSPPAKDICASSISTVTSLIRQFRAQHGLQAAPLMLVYALVMAVITQVRIFGGTRDGMVFFSKALTECAQYYKIAAEARTRLLPYLTPFGATTDSIQERPLPDEPGNFDNESRADFAGHQPGPVTPDAGLSSQSLEENTVDAMLNLDVFDIPGFGDFDSGLHSWFSIGQMG